MGLEISNSIQENNNFIEKGNEVIIQNEDLTLITEKKEELKEKNKIEAQTIFHILNLTTLARLPDQRDLDNLFDGEASLGGEETLALYSILEILNGKNNFSSLKAPIKINMDISPLKQDYSYDIQYDDVIVNGIASKRLQKIVGSGSLPLNTTTIIFHYSENNNTEIKKIEFQRPHINRDQEITLQRDEDRRVNSVNVGKMIGIDNKLTINYDDLGNIGEVKQTKLGISEDITQFGYDIKTGNLKAIIYKPGFSLKKTGKVMNKAKNPTLLLYGISASLENLKKVKGLDIFEIESNSLGVPTSIKNQLKASNWFYTGESTNLISNDVGEIISTQHEKEVPGFDEAIETTLYY